VTSSGPGVSRSRADNGEILFIDGDRHKRYSRQNTHYYLYDERRVRENTRIGLAKARLRPSMQYVPLLEAM
jgi:hypothetical protein